ncbi:hypothetical protein FHG87_007362 [Trinorchestia longiramus]|nr:hypothetical protein FHG87_007362 [Trinorchestia longiramus]
MADRPPIIRVRCEGSEDDCCSSGGEEHHLISLLRKATHEKRHSAPDIRVPPNLSVSWLTGLRKPREKRLSGPALPPSPLTLSPGAQALYQHRASLDENYLDTWQNKRWARLQHRRRFSESQHIDVGHSGDGSSNLLRMRSSALGQSAPSLCGSNDIGHCDLVSLLPVGLTDLMMDTIFGRTSSASHALHPSPGRMFSHGCLCKTYAEQTRIRSENSVGKMYELTDVCTASRWCIERKRKGSKEREERARAGRIAEWEWRDKWGVARGGQIGGLVNISSWHSVQCLHAPWQCGPGACASMRGMPSAATLCWLHASLFLLNYCTVN